MEWVRAPPSIKCPSKCVAVVPAPGGDRLLATLPSPKTL